MFELVSTKHKAKAGGPMQVAPGGAPPAKKKRLDRPTESPHPSHDAKPLKLEDLTNALRGRQAEVSDKMLGQS